MAENVQRSVQCRRLLNAYIDCSKKYPKEPEKSLICGTLNRKLAACLISSICSKESEAVNLYCSSIGTSQKRQNCKEAKEELEYCISQHQ